MNRYNNSIVNVVIALNTFKNTQIQIGYPTRAARFGCQFANRCGNEVSQAPTSQVKGSSHPGNSE